MPVADGELDRLFLVEAGEPIRSYRDLRVWQEGIDLAVCVYRLTEEMPRREMYSLTDQIRRAASSVPANIAEGSGRRHTAEFCQF